MGTRRRASWPSGVLVAALATAAAVAAGEPVPDRAPSSMAASPATPVRRGAIARPAASTVQGEACLASNRASDLDRMFDTEPGGVVGADYQRPHRLPDGRVLWLFQDAVIRLGPDEFAIVHNIGALQDRNCFRVLYGGSRAAPRPMLFADQTVPFRRWFWPLDAEIGDDGLLHVFIAEMAERGAEYLTRTEPVATRLALVDPATLDVVHETSPPNDSPALYGWSMTSDRTWTYLYAQCFRQFGFDPYALVDAFDRSCSTRVTVARVPRGALDTAPTYWDGRTWQSDPSRAVSVIESAGRLVNADQIEWTGSSFFSVNKEGDWWGDTILFSRAERATGPFVVYDTIPAPVKCDECNSFFATWVPPEAAGRGPSTFVVALSHNRWDGQVSSLYRPTFHEVPAPPFLAGGRTFPLEVPGGPDDAVVLNVTAVLPDAPGHVTAFPCDRDRPVASNVNHLGPDVIANLVVVRPDAGGRVCLYTRATTDLVVDLAGRFPAAGGIEVADRPFRVVDSRTGFGVAGRRVRAGETVDVRIPDASDEAVIVNLTAVLPSAPGHLTVHPCDRPRPLASHLNHLAGEVVAKLAVVRADADGRVCLFSLAETDLVVDVLGRLPGGSGFDVADNPARLVDTRIGLGASARRIRAGETLAFVVPGESVTAALLDVVAVFPAAAGHLTVHPCDRPKPTASNVNFLGPDVVANLVAVRPDAEGRVCVVASAETDLVVDVAGVFRGGFEPLDVPTRILDTRTGTGVPR